MARQSRLSAAEKAEVVLQFLRREHTAARLARPYGISEQAPYRYRDEFLAAGKAGLAGNVDAERRIKELERAVADREQIIGELTVANRIPKKTIGRLAVNGRLRDEVRRELAANRRAKLRAVLWALGIAAAT